MSAAAADQRLMQFLKEGKDWERKATNIPGILLLRLPGLRSTTAPSLAIEINPVDSTGSATILLMLSFNHQYSLWLVVAVVSKVTLL